MKIRRHTLKVFLLNLRSSQYFCIMINTFFSHNGRFQRRHIWIPTEYILCCMGLNTQPKGTKCTNAMEKVILVYSSSWHCMQISCQCGGCKEQKRCWISGHTYFRVDLVPMQNLCAQMKLGVTSIFFKCCLAEVAHTVSGGVVWGWGCAPMGWPVANFSNNNKSRSSHKKDQFQLLSTSAFTYHYEEGMHLCK